MEKNGQTVTVLDEHGAVIGSTYPKRAKGLVKKCRAEFVSDHEIRLYRQFPTYENMEENAMNENNINYLYFNARDWHNHYNRQDYNNRSVWSRFYMETPVTEGMTEVMSVGSFDWDRGTVASTDAIEVERNTLYHFVFWLNGGENDRNDETCQLKVIFAAERNIFTCREAEQCLTYPLNRGYIKPVKKYKGWELYDISFMTEDTPFIFLQFCADRAPMAVMRAEAPETYAGLEDVPDEFEGIRPQRHNIFFEDGWPQGRKWYSTAALRNKESQSDESLDFLKDMMKPHLSPFFNEEKGTDTF